MGAGIPISLRKVDTEFYAAAVSLRAGKLGWFSGFRLSDVLRSAVLAGCRWIGQTTARFDRLSRLAFFTIVMMIIILETASLDTLHHAAVSLDQRHLADITYSETLLLGR
jgi:hypothetical protein